MPETGHPNETPHSKRGFGVADRLITDIVRAAPPVDTPPQQPALHEPECYRRHEHGGTKRGGERRVSPKGHAIA